MLARTDSRARALVLLIIAALIAGGIGVRLAWWHVVEHDRLATMALDQLAQNQAIPAQRGEIRDAKGILLATSVQVESIFATPPNVKDKESAAALLAGPLGLPVDDLRAKLTSGRAWVWLARKVEPAVSDKVRALAIPGIGMLPETRRVYPVAGVASGTTIAAQVMGYVNFDGQGQYGIEGAENNLLAGLPGSVTAQKDVAGRRIADSVYELKRPVDGANVTLTIDAGVQHLLEQQIWDAYQKNQAAGATGIVMDVQTGAILGMASYPSFDANNYAATDPKRFTNPAVSRQYEPGSVMKAFTVSAALDAGAMTTTDTVVDNNDLKVGGAEIHNADRYWFAYGHGPITPGQVLELSNNVGAAKIGLKLGGEKLYQAFKGFGFGSPTGIDIAGEASGLVWDPASKNASGDLTTAQNSFGQGISVTAVQMVAGYAAIANGGTLVTPHVIAGWTPPGGAYQANQLPAGRRIISQRTADTVRGLLTDAIDKGIAKSASIPGYSIAGKTGTAQIAGPVQTRVQTGTDANGQPIYQTVTRNQYIDGWIDSSIINIVPAAKPRFVTLIVIHKPAVWGLYQMALRPEQVFRQLAPQLLDYLAIPPDRPIAPVAAR